MKSKNLPLLFFTLLWGGLGHFVSSPLEAQQTYPEGDLTVTVQELENGGVRVSLDGSATVQGYPLGTSEVQNNGALITRTNLAVNLPSPPANTSGPVIPLPAGLALQISYPNDNSEPDAPALRELFLPVIGEMAVPLNEVIFAGGYWCLGSFAVSAPPAGALIAGSGSVTANDIPFYLFAPGTYRIGPPYQISGSESGAEALEPEYASGEDEYFITYIVIPFEPAPAIRISPPDRFPRTRVRREAKAQDVTIKNIGNMRLTKLSSALTGAAQDEFPVSPLRVGALDPGESTQVSVGFRPHRKGSRRAVFSVAGMTEPRLPDPASEVESPLEGWDPEPQPPITVSDSVELFGKGLPLSAGSPWRPNSPRFPHP